MFSDFEPKDFGRVLKTAMFVSRGTFRGKMFLVWIFIFSQGFHSLGESFLEF